MDHNKGFIGNLQRKQNPSRLRIMLHDLPVLTKPEEKEEENILKNLKNSKFRLFQCIGVSKTALNRYFHESHWFAQAEF